MKFSMVFLICSSLLFSSINKDLQEKIQEHYFGFEEDGQSQRREKKLIQSRDEDDDTYLYEVIYEKIKQRNNQNSGIITAKINNEILFNNVAYLKNEIKRIEDEKEKEAIKEKLPQKIHLTGYCMFKNSIEIDMIKTYATLGCEFNHPQFPRAKIMISLIPNPKLKVLIATPIYIDYNNQTLDVLNGVVMTADKTSINIANYVNDLLIKEITAKSLIRGGEIAYQQAVGYLEESQKARVITESTIVYVDDGDGGTTPTSQNVTNTLPPNPNDYITSGLITFASSLVSIFGQAYLSKLNYVFKIYKNNQIYVDLIVQRKDINYNNTSGIKYDVGIKEISNQIINNGKK